MLAFVQKSFRAAWSAFVCCSLAAACSSHSGKGASSVRGGETPEACERNKAQLIELVRALPSRGIASTTRVDLPLASVGRTPGMGPVIEVAAAEVVIDGTQVALPALADRVTKFREWVTAWADAQKQAPEGGQRKAALLYFAVARSVDVQTLRAFLVHVPAGVELRLLVRVPRAANHGPEGETSKEAQEAAVDVLSMPESDALRTRVTAAYANLSRCDAVTQAASSVATVHGRQRWPALQSALRSALPGCDCNGLDSASLRLLVSAEQRAGASSLGWVPLGYLKDERCGASMPLRSMDKLVRQLEEFEDEFSANFQPDAVTFHEVLETERLRVFFCDALPGETIAALANARAVLYLPSGPRACDAWMFTPMNQGAPMGTVKRVQGGLSFHYWQAAEDIRFFGPLEANATSKPTDEREYPCEETLKLTGIDERSIHLGDLQWFYDEATCVRAPEGTNGLSGCVAAQAASSPKG
jgi:hypothetical protein